MKKRAFLTVFALLLASVMLFASCAPAGTNGTVTTQGDTNPATLPEQPGDQTPAEQKVTVEYSLLMSGPTFVTWNANGQRQKEFGFVNGITFNYIYNTQKVLSAIQLTVDGETVEFECQYDDNGVPTKAIAEDDSMGMQSILFAYDSNKKMTKMMFCMQDEIPQFINYYDESGKLCKTELVGMGEDPTEVSGTLLCEYSNDNVSIVKMVTGEENTAMGQITFTYGEDGQLAKMESKNAVDENGTLELYEFVELTHTETNHVVKSYSVTEKGNKPGYTVTYDADWNETESLLYNEEGEVVSKTIVSRDTNGNKVTERFELEKDTLELMWKVVESFDADGALKWEEQYYKNEEGELSLMCKTVYTETGYEDIFYDSEGNEKIKLVHSKDAQGNNLTQQYENKGNGEGLYLSESAKYNSDGDLLEAYWYDEAGTVISKTLRREKTGGGYFLDYYFLNEQNQLVLEYSEEYDSNGNDITPSTTAPDDGSNSDVPGGSTPGGGNDSAPEEEDTGIKNDGANTEGGWGPIFQ